MEQNNPVEWPMNNAYLKMFFDTFGEPDVVFRSGSRSFKVHKKVLEMHSSVLKAKLSDVWQTSGDVLQVDEELVEPEVVEELLTWMYYNYRRANWNRRCSIENAYSLCVAADYLMISNLTASCCHILRNQIAPDNFYDFYTLSKHLSLDELRQDFEKTVSNQPGIYFTSSQIVKCKAEELAVFIRISLEVENSPKVCDIILSSLTVWAETSFVNRLQGIEELLKFVPPNGLSSDALFRFMQTELYSRLDELHRKQYYVRPYLSTGSSSTDKLYCLSRTDAAAFYKVHCLDLSAEGKCSDFEPEHFAFVPVLGTSWREKICLLGYLDTNCRSIKTFSTEIHKWDSSQPLNYNYRRMLSAVAFDDYIYTTDRVYMKVLGVSRYCMEAKQWESLKDMRALRQAHRLVALNDLLYAIGGEPHGKVPRPERYDPRADRWEYITPSNYHHELPAAVAHEGQIYVLSQAGFEAYSPETDRWTRLPEPDVCIKPSLVSIDGRLWLMSDSVDRPRCKRKSPRSNRFVYEFDLVQQEWTRLPDLPEGDYTDLALVIKQ